MCVCIYVYLFYFFVGNCCSFYIELSLRGVRPLFFYGYYVAYKPITLPCTFFLFIEMKFIHCHSCVMFVMKSFSILND